VYFPFLFCAPAYLVGAIPYDAQQYGTAVIVASRLALVGEDGELPGKFQ
jgi:hypothetical protein